MCGILTIRGAEYNDAGLLRKLWVSATRNVLQNGEMSFSRQKAYSVHIAAQLVPERIHA